MQTGKFRAGSPFLLDVFLDEDKTQEGRGKPLAFALRIVQFVPYKRMSIFEDARMEHPAQTFEFVAK